MNSVLGAFNLMPGALAGRGPGRAGSGCCHHWARIAEAFTLSYLDGPWLVLLGWFFISAASAERQVATAEAALAGVR
jgi:hypothetical protein